MSKRKRAKKSSGITIDKSLDKYDNIVPFPDKLEKANKTLERIGLPKSIDKKNRKG